LQGLTNSTFKVQPLDADDARIGDAEYTRSGLLGFLGPVSLVTLILLNVESCTSEKSQRSALALISQGTGMSLNPGASSRPCLEGEVAPATKWRPPWISVALL